MTHIVAIGGGSGATQVLRAVERFAARRTAIIAVTDTGRSTGLARAIGGIPAPGDLRATIAAFADDPLVGRLLQHRFSGAGVPQLEGMAFGNLLIAALAQVTGDFSEAVEWTARLARSSVQVLPVSAADARLCAELEGGAVVEGELTVRGVGKPPIRRLFLRPGAAADPAALAAIRDADLVAIGPGSLFTTVLANLLFDGMAGALREARGRVVYVANTTTQPGQTDGYTTVDHVRCLVDALPAGTLDAVILNRSAPAPGALAAYEAEGLFLLRPDDAEIERIGGLGVRPIVRDLTETVGEKRTLWNKQDTVRHDTEALGAALYDALRGDE